MKAKYARQIRYGITSKRFFNIWLDEVQQGHAAAHRLSNWFVDWVRDAPMLSVKAFGRTDN